MDISRAELEKRYKGIDDKKLIEISKQDLTALAKEVVFEEIASRNLLEEDINQYSEEIVQEKKEIEEHNKMYASPIKRLLAKSIDMSVVCLITITFGFLIGRGIIGDVGMPIAFSLVLLYFWLADGFPNGQSLGKRITNISVVFEESGKPCSLSMSFLRNIPLNIISIFDVVFMFGKRQKRLGDYLAGTIVVNIEQ